MSGNKTQLSTAQRNSLLLELELENERQKRLCELSLEAFTKAAWHIIEPGTKLKWNWHLSTICGYLEAFHRGELPNKRLIINIPPGTLKSILVSVMYPAWCWIDEPEHRILSVANEQGLAIRDAIRMKQIITSDWFQSKWQLALQSDQNEKTLFANEKRGFRQAIGITAGVIGKRGDTLQIDDPIDAKHAFSDVIRKGVNDAWDQSLSSRLNDLENSGVLLIMQRLHETDLAGHLQKKVKTKWTVLSIPMRYEGAPTFDAGEDIGRPDLNDPRTKKGELLFPARFSEEAVQGLEEDLGEYGCNPYEAPVLMRDLSMKPIGEIEVGDKIIGFDKKKRTDDKEGRYKLTEATVLQVQSRMAKVVKMTLDSGEVIRCTRDHKWFMGGKGSYNGKKRPEYLPVTFDKHRQSKLSRVCPSTLPDLSKEDERLAGWLAGFFDGEGTVSMCRKGTDGQYRSSATIQFFQGAGRNLPLCEKLEYALDRFGFEYSYVEDTRKDNKTAACYGYRQYRLNAKHALSTYQRFLHIVQPIKWKQRILDGVLGCKFIQQKERVVSIEDDGEEMVYALTTTTGNYVVWGLASSNSAGQLQQRPFPSGGGIIKSHWWRMWPDDMKLPICDHIFLSYDTAFSERDMKDSAYSAQTRWGVFWHEQRQRYCLIALGRWYERVGYDELRKLAKEWDKTHEPDAHLIEKKATGITLLQDLKRALPSKVRSYCPGKGEDKISRAHSVSPMFESGLIYIPNKSWATNEQGTGLIDYVAKFPNGEPPSADLTDTCTQACIYLRSGFWVSHPDDDDFDVNETKKSKRVAAYG